MSLIRSRFGGRQADGGLQPGEHGGEVVQLHVRQDEVLGVGHPHVVEAVALGEVGDGVHLVGRSSRQGTSPGVFRAMLTMA